MVAVIPEVGTSVRDVKGCVSDCKRLKEAAWLKDGVLDQPGASLGLEVAADVSEDAMYRHGLDLWVIIRGDRAVVRGNDAADAGFDAGVNEGLVIMYTKETVGEDGGIMATKGRHE
jgi:hypothetical protein